MFHSHWQPPAIGPWIGPWRRGRVGTLATSCKRQFRKKWLHSNHSSRLMQYFKTSTAWRLHVQKGLGFLDSRRLKSQSVQTLRAPKRRMIMVRAGYLDLPGIHLSFVLPPKECLWKSKQGTLMDIWVPGGDVGEEVTKKCEEKEAKNMPVPRCLSENVQTETFAAKLAQWFCCKWCLHL